MTRKALNIERAGSVREVPEQVHAGEVELLAEHGVLSREIEAEFVSEAVRADPDRVTRELNGAAAAAGHGNAKNVIMEPRITRHIDHQRTEFVVGNLHIDIGVDAVEIERRSVEIVARIPKVRGLCRELRECGTHIDIPRVFNTLVGIPRFRGEFLLRIIDGAVDGAARIRVADTSARPDVDVRRIQRDITEGVRAGVGSADRDGTDGMAIRLQHITNEKPVSGKYRGCVEITVIAVIFRRSCLNFIARAQTDRQYKREQDTDKSPCFPVFHYTFLLFSSAPRGAPLPQYPLYPRYAACRSPSGSHSFGAGILSIGTLNTLFPTTTKRLPSPQVESTSSVSSSVGSGDAK